MNKLEKLKEKTMDLNNGIYCYYKDNDFYINPVSNDSIEVYYNKKTYYFKNYEEMIIYPLFEDKSSIKDCIDDITW